LVKQIKVMIQTSARFSAFSASNFLDIAGREEFQEVAVDDKVTWTATATGGNSESRKHISENNGRL
jgi:hypothetical protein